MILSIIALGLSILSTLKYGPAVSPDSVRYLSTAENLLKGNSFYMYDQMPYVSWPPLFPMLIALISLFGISSLWSAMIINSLSLALVIFAGYLTFRKYFDRTLFVILFIALIVILKPLYFVSIWVWTEILFILLTLIFFKSILDYLATKAPKYLILTISTAALASMQRYAGITVILSGICIIIFCNSRISLWKRVKCSTLFAIVSSIPIALWLLRNRIVSDSMPGFFRQPSVNMYDQIYTGANVFTGWFLRHEIDFSTRLVFSILIIAVVMTLLIIGRSKGVIDPSGKIKKVLPFIIFIAIYFTFVIATTYYTMDRIGIRYLSPLFVYTAFILILLLEQAYLTVIHIAKRKALIRISITIACSLFFCYVVAAAIYNVERRMKYGAGGFNVAEFRESELLNYCRSNEIDGIILSNLDPDMIYFITGKKALRVNNDMPGLDPEIPKYLVWYDEIPIPGVPRLKKLYDNKQLDILKYYKDGRLILLK